MNLCWKHVQKILWRSCCAKSKHKQVEVRYKMHIRMHLSSKQNESQHEVSAHYYLWAKSSYCIIPDVQRFTFFCHAFYSYRMAMWCAVKANGSMHVRLSLRNREKLISLIFERIILLLQLIKLNISLTWLNLCPRAVVFHSMQRRCRILQHIHYIWRSSFPCTLPHAILGRVLQTQMSPSICHSLS